MCELQSVLLNRFKFCAIIPVHARLWQKQRCHNPEFPGHANLLSMLKRTRTSMIEQRSPFFDRIRIEANPNAHLNSIVTCGQARFTVLTSRLIRLEWSES